MKITKCNCAIKCDSDGCGELATKEISFKGVSTDLRLCSDCFKKLCDELTKVYCNKGRAAK